MITVRNNHNNKQKTISKSNIQIVPVIQRKGKKFIYSQHVLNGRAKNNRNEVIKNNSNTKQSVSKVHQIEQSQLLKQQFGYEESKITKLMTKQQPFLIKNVVKVEFTLPEQVEVAIHEGEQIDYTDNTFYYRISLNQLLQNQKNSSNSKLKMSVPQMQLSKQYYQIPNLVSRFIVNLHKVNLWMYFGNRQTEWHYDGHDNFLYLLQGKKVVYLAEPNSIKSNSIFSLFNNHRDNKQKINTNIFKAEVICGKCLFIPKGWWHRVQSYGNPSIAINYWGDSVKQIIDNMNKIQKSLVLKTLLFQIADEFCKRGVVNWENFTELQKQEFRKMAGHKLMEEGNWRWKYSKQQNQEVQKIWS